MIKILITGHKGFVGKELTKLLDGNDNYEIVVHDNIVNYCDTEQVERIEPVNVIVHLAAHSYVPYAFEMPRDLLNNNIVSTLNIIEKARIDNAKLVFLSTYVYGNPEYLPIDENHRTFPLNPYTQSKLICESLIESYHRDFNMSGIILRPFNIYGSQQKEDFFIPTLFNQINNSEIVLRDDRPKRDFVHVTDVVKAIYLSINKLFKEDNLFTIINVGSGVSHSVKELAAMVINISNSKADLKFTKERRKGEVLNTVANIDKAKSELGWVPEVNLFEGLNMYHKAMN